MKVSVLTIVRGREKHLANQLRGLTRSVVQPDQWVVVGMNQDVCLEELNGVAPAFPIRCERVDSDASQLPLAQARNHAASIAKHSCLVFLDVDCIPDPAMIGHFVEALRYARDALWMGSAHYLPADAASPPWTMDELAVAAKPHPLQPDLALGETRLSKRYEMFWSLCFALTKDTFDRIGGFDEQFVGYGGEDTDFAFAARDAGVQFGFAGARSYHQHHTSCQPPLNHFDAIVVNAQRFRQKWGTWPMESWLSEFEERELIRRTDDQIEIVRRPNSREIDEATCENAVLGA